MTDKCNVNTWVRIVFVFLGAIAILRGVEELTPLVNILSMLPREGIDFRELLWASIGTIVAPTVLIVGGYQLIRRCQILTERLCKAHDKPIPYWEYAAYRLGFTLCGILVISWALPKLGQIFLNFSMRDNPMNENLIRSAFNMLIWLVMQSGIGIYLILGAPHIIRWQVKRGSNSFVPNTHDAE